MNAKPQVTFFHTPNTRSSGVRILLEELDADFKIHVLNSKRKEQRKPEYLAINPMGKVPAIRHGDALVTEQVAIFIYLSDLYPEAGLAPPIGDPLRGPYLRWLAFYGSCFEPAIVDKAQKREPAPASMCPYGDFETMLQTLTGQLEKGPYLLGERFTAADLLWGGGLAWVIQFQLLPPLPVFQSYIERVNGRPAVIRAREKEAALAAEQPE